MLFSLVLFMAAEATPATQATPTASPTAAVTKEGTGRTRTLADVARERKLGVKGVKGGTFSVAGAPGGPLPAARSGTAPAVPGVVSDDEWSARYKAATGEVEAARRALDEAESTLPPVVTTGRSPGAAHAIANAAREGALLPYRTRLRDAESRLASLREEASRAGVPGLVR